MSPPRNRDLTLEVLLPKTTVHYIQEGKTWQRLKRFKTLIPHSLFTVYNNDIMHYAGKAQNVKVLIEKVTKPYLWILMA